MAREIKIKPIEVVIQEEIKKTDDVIKEIRITLDDGGCVMASWHFAGKSYNQVLWDENTTPTYEEIGQWTDEDVDARIQELINQ